MQAAKTTPKQRVVGIVTPLCTCVLVGHRVPRLSLTAPNVGRRLRRAIGDFWRFLADKGLF